jgi:hypothetical protein|tara:strand:+ start:14200 stop:14586 length:387 start_codon:yes stop_codon:yes gene_type:complete
MADSGRMRGWKYDHENSNLEVWVNGTNVGVWDDATNDLVLPTNGLTVTAGGATVTAGDLTVTAGDAHVVAQNLYMGAETAFATTEPTSAIIFKTGTQAAGAIVTSSALFANDTVLRKIIADGTVSNVG